MPIKAAVANFSVKHLDEELIDMWVKVGCDEFLIAVETGSPEMQKKIHKNIDLAAVRNLLQIFQRKKIHVIAMYMIGFPGETLGQINETLNAVKSLRASHSQILLVVPFPGTQLFSDAMKDSLLNFDVNDLEIYQRSTNWIKSDEWDYPMLKEMAYDVNIEVNFLNNSFCDFPEGRKYKIDFYKILLKGLPGHVIAHIMLGYLTQDPTYYSQAKELLKSDSLNQTFGKYLSWNFPAIVEFKQYLQKEMAASGVV
ncbi:MAG: radical SAM protein [Candidatus Omnitrophota bacterium]